MTEVANCLNVCVPIKKLLRPRSDPIPTALVACVAGGISRSRTLFRNRAEGGEET